jgi:acid phosphatase
VSCRVGQTIIRHRLLLPDGVDQDIVDGVEREAGYETAVKFSSPEICRLAIGRFIGDVVDRVQATVDGEDDVRFALYSGHDNTLSPFLSAFNVFDARQPPMASGTTQPKPIITSALRVVR